MKDDCYSTGFPQHTGSGIMECNRFSDSGKYQFEVTAQGKNMTIGNSYSGAGGLATDMIGEALTKGCTGL